MKKYSILALILVLTVTVFTGCRSRRPDMDTAPQTETVMPTIMPTEAPSTMPTVDTTPDSTSGTENPGTIPGDANTTMPSDTTDSTGSTGEGRSRSRTPSMN